MSTMTALPFVGDVATDLAHDALRHVVQVVDGGRGGGSGVVVGRRGLIVTNAHVVRGRSAEVTLHDGAAQGGRVVARDDSLDLAAIRVERDDLEPAAWGDSRTLRPGQLVLAVGHPLGLTDVVTLGIINRLPDPTAQRELIASNITLDRGNSGGPLMDAAGRLVGINAMVAGPGLGLSIPSQTVRRFLAQQVDPRPHIGVTVQPVDTGLIVTGVQPESPAEAAGLMPGDIFSEVNTKPVVGYASLLDGLIDAGIGGRLALDIKRAGKPLSRVIHVVARA